MGIISLTNGIVDSNIDVMLDKAGDPVKDIRLNQAIGLACLQLYR